MYSVENVSQKYMDIKLNNIWILIHVIQLSIYMKPTVRSAFIMKLWFIHLFWSKFTLVVDTVFVLNG